MRPRTRKQSDAWWQQDPEFNIGVATGAVSGIFVVDVDGLDAELELAKLEREHGALPPTVEVVTAPGRHMYFKLPGRAGAQFGRQDCPGVDVRGDNGYVIAPPSRFTRAGRRLCLERRQCQRDRRGARLAAGHDCRPHQRQWRGDTAGGMA